MRMEDGEDVWEEGWGKLQGLGRARDREEGRRHKRGGVRES